MSKITFKRIPEEDYTYLGHSLYAYQSNEGECVYSVAENLKQIKPEDLIVLVSKYMDVWSFVEAEEVGYIDKTKGLVFSDEFGENLYIISYCSFELDEDKYYDFGYISNKNFSGIASSLDFRNDYGIITNAEVIDVIDDGESEKKLIITFENGYLEEAFRYEDEDGPNLFAWDWGWFTSKLDNVTLNDLYRLTGNGEEVYVVNATGIPDEIVSIPASYKQIKTSRWPNIYATDIPLEPTTAPKITDAYEKGEPRHYFEGQNLNAWELKYDLRPTADKYSWIPQSSDSSKPYGYVTLEVYDDGYYYTLLDNIIFTTAQLLAALTKMNELYIEIGNVPCILPDLSLFDPNALWLCLNTYYNTEEEESFWDGFNQLYLLKTEPTFPKDTWYEELGYTSDNLSDFVMFLQDYDEETDQYIYVQTPILGLDFRPNHILFYTKLVQLSDYKGIIYYMKDERGNEAPYDFKNLIIPGEEEDPYDGPAPLLYSTRATRAMSIVYENIGTVYTFTGENGSDASLNLETHDNVIKASRVNNTYQLPYNFIINESNSAMCSNYFGYDACKNVLALENGMHKGGGHPEVTALLAEAETPETRSLSATYTFNPSEDIDSNSANNFEISRNYIGDGCSNNEIVVWNYIQNIKLDMRVTDTEIQEGYRYDDIPSTVGLFNLVIHYPGLNINDNSDSLIEKGILRDLFESDMSTLWYISSQQTYPLDIFGLIAAVAESAHPVKVDDVQDYSRDPQVADAVELKTAMYVTSEALNDLNDRVENLNRTIQLLQQQLNN